MTIEEGLLRRIAGLRPFYRRFPHRGPMPIALLDMRGFYSPREKVFYNRIPKAANSTVTAALVDRSAYRRPLSGGRAKDAFLRPSWMSARDVATLADGDATVFTVVRDPYSRLPSAFRDKIGGDKRQAPHFRAWCAARLREADFDAFCDYLEDGHLHRDAHWAPQVDLLCLPRDCFDTVLKVETLDTDLPALLGRIFGGTETVPPGRCGPRTDADAVRDSAYNDRTRALVGRLYAGDFSAFGYRGGGF